MPIPVLPNMSLLHVFSTLRIPQMANTGDDEGTSLCGQTMMTKIRCNKIARADRTIVFSPSGGNGRYTFLHV